MNMSPKKQRRGIKNVEKIKRIINREFENELNLRDNQLELIQQRINQAQKTLHILRYVIVSTYYNNANKNVSTVPQVKDNSTSNETTPQRLHPAIRKLLTSFTVDSKVTTSDKLKTRGTKQQNISFTESNSTTYCVNDNVLNTYSKLMVRNVKQEVLEASTNIESSSNELSTTNLIQSNTSEYKENLKIARNRNKKEYVVVVGNISKWMPAESNEDKSTHKWMVYVRGPKTNPNISHFVQKVVFYLHPSYKPNDVVEVKNQPFHLSRRGWGEFPLRVRIFFIHTSNKPVDIVHQLKLDKTFTGRQTLGNETIVNLQLFTNGGHKIKSETIVKEECNSEYNYLEHDYCHQQIKQEPVDDDTNIIDLDHSYCNRSSTTPTVKEIEQPENELIYGLNYENTGCTESIIEESVLDDAILLKVSQNQSVLTSKNKRKSETPLVNQVFEKKQRLYDSYIDTSKFQLEIVKQRYKNVLQVLPFLFKHLPIITKLARNNTYKCIYPYVAATTEEYLSWNIGRRLSSEWFQAKTILNIIRTNQIPDCTNWTTKKMIMYARAHGYTPLANYKIFKRNPPDYIYDYIPNGEAIEDTRPIIEPNEELVEVTDTNKVSVKPEKYAKVTQLIDLNLQKASSYIRHAVLDVGVILKPEEIVPGVLFSAAERVLLQAVLCLAEDLIRKARAKLVHEGNFKEDASIITTDHICKVLSSRSEFNLLLQSDVG